MCKTVNQAYKKKQNNPQGNP